MIEPSFETVKHHKFDIKYLNHTLFEKVVWKAQIGLKQSYSPLMNTFSAEPQLNTIVYGFD